MKRLTAFLRSHRLWAGLGATLVPLVLLVWLQYRWLSRLEDMSTIAHRAALDNALDAIGNETRYFYLASAERLLNVPASVFIDARLPEIVNLWEKRPVEGARLFVIDFTHETFGTYLSYEPSTHTLVPMLGGDEALAIIVAVTPWQLVIQAGGTIRPVFDVNERDPDHRMILNPIVDTSNHLVGLAGMVLDEQYFRTVLLPQTIERTLAKLLPQSRRDVMVSVRDAKGNDILPAVATGGETVSRRIPFVFSDWTMTLHGGASAPERWARASFVVNMALALVVAAVLAGGIVLTIRAADRAMALSQLKSEFVSNVSHELRTPLASIRVFAELLRLGRVTSPAKVQEYGDSIETESVRLSRLVDNILDFSRIESGRKTYRFELTDLRTVAAAALHSFDVRLRHAGFAVHVESPPELPLVEGDPEALGQALANLLDNAIKYSEDARELHVRLAATDGEVTVAVTDQGIGIPRADHAKIFERFHRVGTGLVHDVKGSGLGLGIVAHIIQAHRGRVTVDSEPGRGSTFTIRLPAAGGTLPEPV